MCSEHSRVHQRQGEDLLFDGWTLEIDKSAAFSKHLQKMSLASTGAETKFTSPTRESTLVEKRDQFALLKLYRLFTTSLVSHLLQEFLNHATN